VVKQVAPESELWRLEPGRLDALLDALEASCPTIAAPLRLDGDRRITIDGDTHYAFEWIGAPPVGASPPRRPRPSLDNHLALTRRLTAELASVEPALRADLASTGLPYLPDPARLGELIEGMADALAATADDTRVWVDAAADLTPTDCTHLVHGDLNTSNIVTDHAGALRVVDIDNLRLGSPYTDTLWVLGFMGAPRDAYDPAIDDLRAAVGGLRPPARHDVVQAIGILTAWLAATQEAARASTRVSQQRDRVSGGTGTLLAWARDLAG
jgi:aminoglycoside phosphotransferase (APT) family kinase protein